MNLARHSDPETSHDAAKRAAEFAGSHRDKILRVLKRNGPADPEQIAAFLNMDAYAVRKRLPELEDMGRAKPTGGTSRTVSGRNQRIWGAV